MAPHCGPPFDEFEASLRAGQSTSGSTCPFAIEEIEDACTFEDLLRCIAKKHGDLKYKHSQLVAAASSREATTATLGFSNVDQRMIVDKGSFPARDLTDQSHLFDETSDPPAKLVPQSQETDLPKSAAGGEPIGQHDFAEWRPHPLGGDEHRLKGPRSAMQEPSPSFYGLVNSFGDDGIEVYGNDDVTGLVFSKEEHDMQDMLHMKDMMLVNKEVCALVPAAPLLKRDSKTSSSGSGANLPKQKQTQFERLDYNKEGIISAWNTYQCLKAIHSLHLASGKAPSWPKVLHAMSDYSQQCNSLSLSSRPSQQEFWTVRSKSVGIDFSQYQYLVDDVDKHVFPPCELMMQVRDALRLEDTNTFVRLRTRGLMVKNRNGVTSNMIDTISATVICINALVLGISADFPAWDGVWEFIEFLFTAYFTGELVYKGVVNGPRWFFLGVDNKWNLFDLAVVTFALADTTFTVIWLISGVTEESSGQMGQVFPIIKMIRLGRLARLVRLLRLEILSELKSMIQGVVAGARVLFWAVSLLFVIIFFLAVLLRKTVGDSTNHYATHLAFEDLFTSMFTIFRCITAGCAAYDGTPLEIHLFKYYGPPFFVIYSVLILCVTIGVFNLIMAIFIDNVMSASIHRKQRERGENAEVMETKLKEMILTLAQKDEDVDREQLRLEDIQVTREHFNAWLENKQFLELLNELDIGSANKSELFDTLDFDLSGELEASEVITGLMKLRGPSDKCDAVAMLLGLRYVTQKVEDLHRKMVVGEVEAAI